MSGFHQELCINTMIMGSVFTLMSAASRHGDSSRLRLEVEVCSLAVAPGCMSADQLRHSGVSSGGERSSLVVRGFVNITLVGRRGQERVTHLS